MQVTRQKDGKTQYLYAVEVNELDGVALVWRGRHEPGKTDKSPGARPCARRDELRGISRISTKYL